MKRSRRWTRLAILATAMLAASCSRQAPSSGYPVAVDLDKVGTYPAAAKSGGGHFYDEVLEYRVWVHPDGDDYHHAFTRYEEAKQFSEKTEGAEEPLVLVLQREHVNEPEPGRFVHVKRERITEWRVEWLSRGPRGPDSIPEFLRKKTDRRK